LGFVLIGLSYSCGNTKQNTVNFEDSFEVVDSLIINDSCAVFSIYTSKLDIQQTQAYTFSLVKKYGHYSVILFFRDRQKTPQISDDAEFEKNSSNDLYDYMVASYRFYDEVGNFWWDEDYYNTPRASSRVLSSGE
jgi:hypothetical protein